MQWDPQVVTHAVGLVHLLFLEDKPTSGIDQLVIIYKTLVGIDNILLYYIILYEPFTYFCEG